MNADIIISILATIFLVFFLFGILNTLFLPIPREMIRIFKFKKMSHKYNFMYQSVHTFPNFEELSSSTDKINTARTCSGFVNGHKVMIKDILEFISIPPTYTFRMFIKATLNMLRFVEYRKYYTEFSLDDREEKVSNDGYAKIEEIEDLFKMYGSYSVKTKTVKRFKCNDTNDNVIVNEYLHVLIKNDCQKSVAVIDVDNGLENTVVGICKQDNIIDTSNDTEQNDCDDVAMEVETNVLKNNEMIGVNEIYNRCCIEGMKDLPNKIIDLVQKFF